MLKAARLILFRVIIDIYRDNHMMDINVSCNQNEYLRNVTAGDAYVLLGFAKILWHRKCFVKCSVRHLTVLMCSNSSLIKPLPGAHICFHRIPHSFSYLKFNMDSEHKT